MNSVACITTDTCARYSPNNNGKRKIPRKRCQLTIALVAAASSPGLEILPLRSFGGTGGPSVDVCFADDKSCLERFGLVPVLAGTGGTEVASLSVGGLPELSVDDDGDLGDEGGADLCCDTTALGTIRLWSSNS